MGEERDRLLIERVRAGSTGAGIELFRRYWPLAWKTAYAVTGNRALADDAAQEAIHRAFRALDRFDDTRPFAPWLTRISLNQAIEELRRSRRVAAAEGRFEELWTSSSSGGDELDSLLAAAVAGLPPGRRLVVVLHYWLDLSLDEISGLLDVPVGTVASRLSRALAELRKTLEEQHVE